MEHGFTHPKKILKSEMLEDIPVSVREKKLIRIPVPLPMMKAVDQRQRARTTRLQSTDCTPNVSSLWAYHARVSPLQETEKCQDGPMGLPEAIGSLREKYLRT